MKCYRPNCKEECSEIKKLYCIMRINKEQSNMIETIKKVDRCKYCGEVTVKARHHIDKYKYIKIRLCTNCGIDNAKIA